MVSLKEKAKVVDMYDVKIDASNSNENYETDQFIRDNEGMLYARVYVLNSNERIIFERAEDEFLSECDILEYSENGYILPSYIEENYNVLQYMTPTSVDEYESEYNVVVVGAKGH